VNRIDYDGVEFSDDVDFVDLARKALLWKLGGSLPSDLDALDWVERVYQALEGSPYHDRLARAISVCLTDDDPVVRREALMFFEQFPQAAGGERILDLASDDRSRLFGDDQLHFHLLRAVAERINMGDSRAIDIAKKEALSPGQPQHLIASLTWADPSFVIDHAEEIVRARPETCIIILYNLEQQHLEIAYLGVRIAPHMARDPGFPSEFERLIDDAEAKRRVLNAIASP